jgi:hypothetical protein
MRPTVTCQLPSARFSLPKQRKVCVDGFPITKPIKSCLMEIKGLTFEQIGKAINKDEVWVAALFYGQVSLFPRPTP